MENGVTYELCKYCKTSIESATEEGLKCKDCEQYVHVKCLRKGSVPGGLSGDVFFVFTCQECSSAETEGFVRDKMPWLQAIVIVLYHMQARTPGLARKGFFHWNIHIAAFIDKHWDTLFSKDFKRKKKWTGTISGTLSHYSPVIFSSGTALFNDPGWWTLTFPKLTPHIIVQTNSEFLMKKQRNKEQKILMADTDLFEQILHSKAYLSEDLLTKISTVNSSASENLDNVDCKPGVDFVTVKDEFANKVAIEKCTKRTNLLPSFEKLNEGSARKLFKTNKSSKNCAKDNLSACLLGNVSFANADGEPERTEETFRADSHSMPIKSLDPFCYYNTSLNDLSRINGIPLNLKLTGGVREEPILSPYSSIYLKPYIRRDPSTFPPWLQLMAEILLKANRHRAGWKLPARGPIDYVYVQPSHIPAVNSLCSQFFWPGIDVTDCLQYPDFSCVALYRRLIVGFAFVVPDVKFNESYVSFIFTRPGWRNAGIAKFMLYHLVQTSTGKDLTLHVSINNPALFLYQKFGFKVEHVELDFYDKYFRRDTTECKHAFFCRLER